MKDIREERERLSAYIVWESLERASDHLMPGHPAELHIRRALAAAEAHWKTLPPSQDEPTALDRADSL